MNRVLRLVSFGGWLAHWINQYTWMNPDHSNCVRPFFLSLAVGISGFCTGLAVMGLLDPLARRGESWIQTLTVALLFGGFALLLVAGWLTNTVPFVATKEEREPRSDSQLPPGEAVEMHATGVVGVGDNRARFRHRQAVLERRADGELHLLVRKWRNPFKASSEPRTSASAHLLPGEVARVRRGTAHLVTEARPAVCFRWKHGPVTLDFDDAETRDRVYAELIALVSVGSSAGGPQTKRHAGGQS